MLPYLSVTNTAPNRSLPMHADDTQTTADDYAEFLAWTLVQDARDADLLSAAGFGRGE
jgi:hypothetical protein